MRRLNARELHRPKRIDDGKTSALFLGTNTRRRARSGCGSAGATPTRARRLIILDFNRHAAARSAKTACFVLAEALFGNFAGLALCFLLALVTLFFLALASVSGFTLVAVDRRATGAATRLFLGNFALFGLTHTRVGECMGAGAPLFFSQCAEDHA
jgi:hypothetical protein